MDGIEKPIEKLKKRSEKYADRVRFNNVTNADRIRAMSDEKLVALFANNDCGYCRIHDFCFAKGSQINCEDAWLDWLKQEAEEE